MASGFFAILDDVATLLDDAAVMSKVAAKKTAGLLGDDLAVNAEKATGFDPSKELPIIWAITKGSILNKIIILPLAFILSAYASWLIVPILLLGGAYLSYEGAEKVSDWLQVLRRKQPEETAETIPHVILTPELESRKIKSAIRTDFILSIEIIIITLSTVFEQSLFIQVMVVSGIAILATIGVYGLVAFIVRLDDMGLYLLHRANEYSATVSRLMSLLGQALINALPRVIRLLTIIGTLAMLLVGGGMYIHNIHTLHQAGEYVPLLLAELIAGLVIGFILLGIHHLATHIRNGHETEH